MRLGIEILRWDNGPGVRLLILVQGWWPRSDHRVDRGAQIAAMTSSTNELVTMAVLAGSGIIR